LRSPALNARAGLVSLGYHNAKKNLFMKMRGPAVVAVITLAVAATLLTPGCKTAQQSTKPAKAELRIPRVSKPWKEALRLVGDGKTLYSDFALIKDKRGRWHCIGTFGKGSDGDDRGYYYLWVSGIDYSRVSLYISEDPFNFGDPAANQIEEQPGHAPEIASSGGRDYMACSMVSTVPSATPAAHDLDGILIQPLRWDKPDSGMEARVTRKL
jgi:hypothetical protein